MSKILLIVIILCFSERMLAKETKSSTAEKNFERPITISLGSSFSQRQFEFQVGVQVNERFEMGIIHSQFIRRTQITSGEFGPGDYSLTEVFYPDSFTGVKVNKLAFSGRGISFSHRIYNKLSARTKFWILTSNGESSLFQTAGSLKYDIERAYQGFELYYRIPIGGSYIIEITSGEWFFSGSNSGVKIYSNTPNDRFSTEFHEKIRDEVKKDFYMLPQLKLGITF